MLRLYILVIFVWIISTTGVLAQRLKFEHYNNGHGLSHNAVSDIVQDKNGFLWLGTNYGLNRFDGYSFHRYFSSPEDGSNGLSHDDITALGMDQLNNKLWVGTKNGLTVLKLDTFQFSSFLPEKGNPNGLPQVEVRAVYVDMFNRVWVGTKSKGLFVLSPDVGRFEKVNIDTFEYINEIFEDKKGNIWIGSHGKEAIAKISLDATGEISGLNTYVLERLNVADKLPYVQFIYEDFKSDIFVGTRKGGLFKLDVKTNTFKNLYIENDAIRKNLGPHFFSLAQAPDGKYWLGTMGGIVICNQIEDIVNGDFQWHFSKINDDTSLVDNNIAALYFDKSGVLWIGTKDGLDKYDPFENLFTTRSDISNYIDTHFLKIRGFAKTYDSKLIVATRQKGLFTLDDKEFLPLFDDGHDIASMYSFDGKTFYLGLWTGELLVYDYLRNKAKTITTGIKNELILSIAEYSDTEIIIGSYGKGVVVFNKETLEIVEPASDLLKQDAAVTKIVNDGNKNIWIGTEQGITKYNTLSKQAKTYKSEKNGVSGLPHSSVTDIVVDSKNNIWAATQKGLAKYIKSKDHFEAVKDLEEIDGIWITGMVLDKDDNLWLNLNSNKVAKYNIELKKVNVYNISSAGNRSDVFSSRGFYNFDNNGIFLGGKDGIINFFPDQITENKWSPAPVITRFKIDKSQVVPGQEVKGQIPLTMDLNYNNNVELNYNNRNFSIVFSAPSYSNQKLNKFEYMLEGHDETWTSTNYLDRTIQYAGLSPDNYTFKIRAQNSDGYWSQTTSYNIKIRPTFWWSLPGIILMLAIITVLVYFITKQLKYRLDLKRALLMEKIKRERDEKLNNEKLRFFTNISHELRTPLTLILGPVRQLLEGNKSNVYDKSRINLIHQNADRLLRLVNQILDFRKTETGELKLKVIKTEIQSKTKDVFSSFEELAVSKDINFNLNIENGTIDGWIDIDKYDKILYNLLSNAMKFTENFGNVDLFVGVEQGEFRSLVIEVSDDGIGIPIESQESIFSRFYQASNSKEITTGTGIGLSFVKALVDIHKGEIKVESTPKIGSVFTVKLPISRECYSEEEIFEFTSNKVKIGNPKALKVKKISSNTDIKQKLLVIEDNMELRRYIVEFLSDYYKVYEAENGKEGLEICRKVKPVLCVVDAMMPEMDGFECIQAIKNDDNISHTSIILLTALAENENKIKGYKVGVDGYLVKPFDPSLLKTRIENIIKIKSDLKLRFLGEAETDVSTIAHSQVDVDFVSRVNEIIDKNMGNPELSTKYLCDELGMSSSKLYRKIKELTDLSPNEFIRTVRLKKGAVLLKSKRYNVSEVTDLVGFNDPLYFSRCFKNQFGSSPSSYIKS